MRTNIYRARLHATMAILCGLGMALLFLAVFRVGDNLATGVPQQRDWLYYTAVTARVVVIGLCLVTALLGVIGVINITRIENRRRARTEFRRRQNLSVVKAGVS